MYYVNIREGLKSTPKLVDAKSNIAQYLSDKEKDYYESLFYYTEEHKNILKERGSLSGIKNTVTDRLYFDFDNEDNVEEARKSTLETCFRLVDAGVKESSIAVYFSGLKGFNVEVALNTFITPEQFKQYTVAIAGDLPTFDKVVHDPNRIIRIPNTKHHVSKLYKISLSLEELESSTVEEIKQKAASTVTIPSLVPSPLPQVVITAIIKKEKVEKISGSLRQQLDAILTNKPRHWKDYKYALASGFFESGERHQALMIVAATCRGLGYDQLKTYHLCKATIERQAEIFDAEPFPKEELWENIIEKSIFSDNWQGGQFSPKSNEWLKSYCEKWDFDTEANSDPVIQIEDAFNLFKDFAVNIDALTIKTGIDQLDENLRMTIGMSTGIVAPPGAGKTSIVLQMLKNMSEEGHKSIFFSYDMYHSLVFTRLVQKEFRMTSDDIYDRFKFGDFAFQEKVLATTKEKYKNVKFCFKTGQTVDDICGTIKFVEESTGEKVRFIVVDYSELVISDISDPTQSSAFVAQKMREIATTYNLCVLSLFQPTKLAGDPSEEITTYTSAKGSGAISQSVSVMLGMSRPGYNSKQPEDDKFLTINCVKNRMGPLFSIDLNWDGLSGNVRSLTDEEESHLAEVRERKSKERQQNDM